MEFHDLVPTLQVSIGPVILISGVGLLLLSMTNRFGRVIDRSRQLVDARRKANAHQRQRLLAQLDILARRSKLVRMSILLASMSLLLAAILIITMFTGAVLHFELSIIITTLFIACMLSLIGSLIMFIRDINLSLAALELEMAPEDETEP